ncbi:MAG: carboxypeptidase regulatory-like domain-containing protein [Bryobacterales bacterium]|nr:carboxypeptidase regulatory-like domain-containing protein [Bryobacterales bacterium]
MRSWVISSLVCLLSGLAAYSQTIDATLSGAVSDPSEAAIPGAAVTAQNLKTGVTTVTRSNASGVYAFPALPAGSYRVDADAPGFRKKVFREVTLEVGGRVTLDFSMEISTTAETVEVSADADSALAYASSSVGGMVTGRKVLELPLTSRNALDLTFIQAGVVGSNFAGARIGTLNIQIDGINVQDARINSGVASTVFPSTDRIEEFRVVTSPVDSELGRGSGQVQMLTRSGTNEFHGSLFEFHRNTVLNANTWFNNQRGMNPRTGEPVSPRNNLIRNQFGGRVGGPVRKNRTFFHFLYEGQRIRSRAAVTSTVLTEAARRGNYRYFPGVQNGNVESATPVVDLNGNPLRPAGAAGDLMTVSVFGRDPARLSADPTGAVARQIERMPLPNNFRAGDGLNTAGYTWSRSSSDDLDQLNLKIDHVLSNAHRLAFSWSRDTGIEANGFLPQPYPDAQGGSVRSRDSVYSLTLTSVVRSNLVNEVRIGALRPQVRFTTPWETDPSILPKQPASTYVTVPLLFTNPINQGNDPQGRISPNYQFFEKMSWLTGKHSVKFGGNAYFVSTNGYNAFDVLPRVNIGAGGAPVRGIDTIPGIGRNQAGAQNLLLDLSGSVASIRQALNSPGGANPEFLAGEPKQRTWYAPEFSTFIQDDYKLTKDLTLTLGIRYEWYAVPQDRNGRAAALAGGSGSIFGLSGRSFADMYQPGRIAGSPTRVELVGRNSPNPSRKLYNNDWNNFAPAIGVAWNIPFFGKGKTTFRAGYSMGYERNALRIVDVVAGDQPGLRTISTFNSSNALSLANITLPLAPIGRVLEEVPLTDRTQIIRTFDDNLRIPYVQNWNASIDRELPGRAMLSVRYVANKGTRLIRGTSVNEHMIFENGILEAFRLTQAGGNAPLFDRLLRGLNVPGFGVVDGRQLTGSRVFREANTTTQGHLAGNNAGAFAAYLNSTPYLTNVRGGLLRNGGFPENWIVANPQFDSARLTSNYAASSYHSMQVEVVKRFSRGWTFQGNYTWAKTLGEEEGAEQEFVDSYRDLRNWRLDKRLLSFHRTHVIRTNALWELPFGPNKPLFSGAKGVVGKLVGGWQVGSIFNVFSGAPVYLSSGVSSWNNFGDNTPVAVTAIDKGLGQIRRVGNGVQYFDGLRLVTDPSVSGLSSSGNLQGRSTLRAVADASGNLLMVNPIPGTLGNVAPNLLEGPGAIRLDLNMLKTVRFSEAKSLQFDFIFQNASNSPNFDNPNADINSLNFGRITGAGGNRIIVIGARFNF